jgi:transposase
MSERAEFWSRHLATISAEKISTQAYAEREGLSVASLYYWRKRLNGSRSAQVSLAAGHFVAVQVHQNEEQTGCQLHIGSRLQLDLPQLPSPRWLAQLHGELNGQVR